ncbi:MAG: prepilin peptidase [Pirellulales bacterium]|nr:prepilin peptidase [Pirellulales bacterium]
MTPPTPPLDPDVQGALQRARRVLIVEIVVAIGAIALLLTLHAARLYRQEVLWPWNTVTGSIVTTVWLFCLGASIGSFLNVVVHRWPAGKSIVHPPSHCPVCGNRIRGRDNVPVLGWLWLGGRCRDCGCAIAARYPTIELWTGCMFVVVAQANLGYLAPWTDAIWFDSLLRGPLPRFLSLEREAYWALFVVGATAWCALLAAGLMRRDGRQVDARVWLAGGLGIGIGYAWLQKVLVHTKAAAEFFDPTLMLILALCALAAIFARLRWQGEPLVSVWLVATVALGWPGGALIVAAGAASYCLATGLMAPRGRSARPWLEHVVFWYGAYLLVKLPPAWFAQSQRDVWTALLVLTCLIAAAACLMLAGWLRPAAPAALGETAIAEGG